MAANKTTKPSQVELDTLLLVNCARLSHSAPLLAELPAADPNTSTPVALALADLVPLLETHAGPGFRWYLVAPQWATPQLTSIARAWQTSVTKLPLQPGMVRVKCPTRVASLLTAFSNGKLPHLTV